MRRSFALAAVAAVLTVPAGAQARVIQAETVLPPGQSGFVPAAGTNPHLTDQLGLYQSFAFKPAGFDLPGMNVDIARETTRLVRYVPAAGRALAPLDRANRQLQKRLAGAADSEAQALVLSRFVATLASIGADVRRLKPPAVLESANDEQLRRLEATRRLADRLRRALRAQGAEQVAVLLGRFRSTTPEGGARRRLANQAVARYSERLKRLGAAYQDVRSEQIRLGRQLG
jgi:hypothetical protein